jgi:pyruvate carboxylase
VAAPFTGVVTIRVQAGDEVSAGTVVATIEAMKMEAGITASISGTVAALTVDRVASVRAGDLLLRITPTSNA